jgi:Family of unknown function (DUF6519)
MKADLTRDTFDPRHHFRSVLAQQGRVQLDAELNESSAIAAWRDETTAADIIGHCGGPADGAAFGLSAAAGAPGDFMLSAGRYYVNGVQCVLEEPVKYTEQPDLPGLTPLGNGTHLVYLHVWQRHLTFLDKASLLEPALGGVDTTTRVKTVWQLRTLPVSGTPNCSAAYAGYTQLTAPSTIRLEAREQHVPGSSDPCQMAESSGYTSLENQLYRVEIHSLIAADAARGVGRAAVWKWSRENGSIEAELKSIAGTKLTVSSLGRDEKLGIRKGHYVEITDDSRELAGLPGDLIEVDDVDEEDLTITLKTPPLLVPAVNVALHPRVRRWEGMENASNSNAYTTLEAGVQVRLSAIDTARPGDYWQIPARTSAPGAQAGKVLWPKTGTTPQALLPHGVAHHFCRLGFAVFGGAAPAFTDCRCLWPALTQVPRLFYLSGDGQEVMPRAALNKLPQVLAAGLANSHCLAGVQKVRFTVLAPGAGRVAEVGGALATQVEVPINAAGEALCEFHLDDFNYSQQVLADLLDATGQPVRPYIVYNATLSIASEVSYDPQCKGMAGQRTVQSAITLLAGAVHVSAVGGDGQDGSLGKALPLPLRVSVTSACGPLVKRNVVFRSAGKQGVSGQFAKSAGGNFENVITAETNSDGIAECWWKLPASSKETVFEASASLETVKDIHLEGPSEVRFTANLRTGGADEDPGAVHITAVNIEGNQDPTVIGPFIPNGSDVAVRSLIRPIMVSLDAPLESRSVAIPDNQGNDSFGIPSNPVAFLTAELPWPLLRSELADVEQLGVKGGILGFRPFILRAHAEFKAEEKVEFGTLPHRISFDIPTPTLQFLDKVLARMQNIEVNARLLLRLTIKGHFIWRETPKDELEKSGPAGWLDGDSWRVTKDQHPNEMLSLMDPRLVSGDRRRGGDFEMWFWLVPDAVQPEK